MSQAEAHQVNTRQFLWEHARIPPRFEQIDWTQLSAVPPRTLASVRAFCASFPIKGGRNGLYLWSPTPGTGKTALAITAIRETIRLGKVRRLASFFTMQDIIEICRQTFPEQTLLEDHPIGSRLFESELLVIDDVGKGRLTEWASSEYFRVINRLYNECRPVIFTSNLPPSGLIKALNTAQKFDQPDELFGHTVVSRIVEMCEEIRLNGADYRLG